jgi:hypothetical protein
VKKDLNDIVHSAFEGEGAENAPNAIWSTISDELGKSKVDSAVKESFEAQYDKAPELVWERVQDQLDVDRVWTRIASKISIRKYGYLLRNVAILLILLLPFNLDFDFIDSSIDSSDSNIENLGTSNELALISDKPNKKTVSKDHVVVKLIANEPIVHPSRIIIESHEPIKPVEYTVDHLSMDAHMNTLPLVSIHQASDLELQSLFTPKPKKRSLGLIVGGVASLENTWILDNETRSGFDNGSLVENEFSIGTSYGIFAEYQWKRRFSISGEYLFQSRSNQQTQIYDKGKYMDKEREINSYKLALMLGWNTHPKFHGVSHSTVLRFGGYYSGVKSDYTSINHVITGVNSIYKRHDAGLRLELGKRIYLKSFIIEGGMKADYGMVNLASSKTIIPPHLNFTRLVSGGIYLKAAYAF